MGLAMLLPRYYGAWIAGGGVFLIAIAMVFSYRPPARLVPRWFRDEIANGVVPAIHKDFIDHVYFVLLLGLVVIFPISLVLLIVVFEGAGSPP